MGKALVLELKHGWEVNIKINFMQVVHRDRKSHSGEHEGHAGMSHCVVCYPEDGGIRFL
jgi:hypothetical protein